jgi:toxin FitB
MTSITLAEIRYGIAQLPDGRRKQILLDTADDIFRTFSEQVLPVDEAAAEYYAMVASARAKAGRPISGFDALIAAVCRSHGAVLATRSLPDFDGTGIEIVDPWATAT